MVTQPKRPTRLEERPAGIDLKSGGGVVFRGFLAMPHRWCVDPSLIFIPQTDSNLVSAPKAKFLERVKGLLPVIALLSIMEALLSPLPRAPVPQRLRSSLCSAEPCEITSITVPSAPGLYHVWYHAESLVLY